MGLYSKIPGFVGPPGRWGIVTTFHPTSNGPGRGSERNIKEIERSTNQWMRGALAEYRETADRGLKANVLFLARACYIPRATLQRRISGDITGTDHAFFIFIDQIH